MQERNLTLSAQPVFDETQRRAEVLEALFDVKDPEIPTISVVDLGVITNVTFPDTQHVCVTMTPTFVGCPAIDVMKNDVENRLRDMNFNQIEVVVDYTIPWNSNRVTEKGREALRIHGLATPTVYEGEFDVTIMLNAECPHCKSTHTTLRSPFGPTLCRALYYCNSCKQGFEQFKPL